MWFVSQELYNLLKQKNYVYKQTNGKLFFDLLMEQVEDKRPKFIHFYTDAGYNGNKAQASFATVILLTIFLGTKVFMIYIKVKLFAYDNVARLSEEYTKSFPGRLYNNFVAQ